MILSSDWQRDDDIQLSSKESDVQKLQGVEIELLHSDLYIAKYHELDFNSWIRIKLILYVTHS